MVRVSVTDSVNRSSISFRQLVVRVFLEQDGRVHFCDGEELAEAVVEFARKFAALFVLKLQDTDA